MVSRVILTRETIPRLLSMMGEPGIPGSAGAWLDFRGVVRGSEAVPGEAVEVPIEALDYEAYEPMAVRQLELILERLKVAHSLEAMLVIHRVGRVPVGEASLFVRILAKHRGEALHACAEFLDQLKSRVPIWKCPVRRPPRPS